VQSKLGPWAVTALLLGALVATSSCRGLRASRVPLGGKHEEEPVTVASASSAPGAAPALSALSSAEERAAKAAEEVAVQAPAAAEPAKPSEPAKPAAAGAFQLRPYAAGQTWTRVFDAEFDMKIGAGMDMRMVNHQEARFEVLGASAGNLDKLGIEYTVDTAKMTVMGREQNEPQPLAGKRYVITFPQGKPEVKSASGGTPSKKELDSVNDDAREPVAMALALKELAQLTAKGKGDFTTAGAIALAGGEDDDTKVSGAKASLQKLSSGARGERSALLDIAYTLASSSDPDMIIELQVSGSMTVLDAPSRYQSITLQGPMLLKPTKSGGMEGRGTGKVRVSYSY
jgi:hypothetical protein